MRPGAVISFHIRGPREPGSLFFQPPHPIFPTPLFFQPLRPIFPTPVENLFFQPPRPYFSNPPAFFFNPLTNFFNPRTNFFNPLTYFFNPLTYFFNSASPREAFTCRHLIVRLGRVWVDAAVRLWTCYLAGFLLRLGSFPVPRLL